LLDDFPSLPLEDLSRADAPTVGLTNYQSSRPKGSKKWSNSLALKLGGGIAAALLVVGLLAFGISTLSGVSDGAGSGITGIPDWAAYFVPENAKLIAYANVDKLRNNNALYQDIAGKPAIPIPVDFPINDINEVFLSGCSFRPGSDEPIIVVRMKTERSLKDLLPESKRNEHTRNFKNVDYVGLGKTSSGKEWVLAKIAESDFCCAPSEEMLTQALERRERKQCATLDKNLQAGLDAVADGNIYASAIGLKEADSSSPIDSVHFGIWLASSVEIQLTLAFQDTGNAESCKKKIDETFAKLKEMPAQQQAAIASLLSAINIRQYGKELNFTAKWANNDLLAFVNKLKESSSQFLGRPVAAPNGAFPSATDRPPAVPPPANQSDTYPGPSSQGPPSLPVPFPVGN
jgi:hypothetical protein